MTLQVENVCSPDVEMTMQGGQRKDGIENFEIDPDFMISFAI